MKHIIRKIFTLRPFENVLVFLLGKFPKNYFLTGIRPSNRYYPPGTMRYCRRYGINYHLDISDYQNWLLYFYSDADSSFGILNYVNKADTILDIGGNIGQTAMMMAGKVTEAGKVFSFEPFPSTYAKFSKNISLNPGLQQIVQVENCALGNTTAVLKMRRNTMGNSGNNKITTNLTGDGEMIEVPVSTIDIFTGRHQFKKIDLIKIDVEGFEMNVLKGGIDTLKKYTPKLFIELFDKSLQEQGSSSKELISFLKGLGYLIFEDGKTKPLEEDDIYRHIDIFCTTARS